MPGAGLQHRAARGARPRSSFPSTHLLRESDVVTLHLPLNADTHHLIGREQLASDEAGRVPRQHRARGAGRHRRAARRRLESGKLGGAALDVLEGEEGIFYADRTTSPVDHPFLLRLQQLPNAIVTPHTAYYTRRDVARHRRNDPLNCLSFERSRVACSRLKIAILFGGCSEEHDVSVKSATEIATSIDPQKYEPFYIGITKIGCLEAVRRPSRGWEDGNCRRAVISPDRETHGLLVAEDGRCRAVHIDAVFPVLHGKIG